MKDKHGNELPPIKVELRPVKEHTGKSAICHNCKQPIKNKQYTYRLFQYPGTFSGERIQGPLCPNCSELPTTHLPSRKYEDPWW